MDDCKIVDLYHKRSESAINETENKYGRYCRYIANNILGDAEMSEECVDDAYLKLWNSIPPNRPKSLKAYLATITRHLAINRMIHERTDDGITGLLDEFYECIPDEQVGIDDKLHMKEAINTFLTGLDKRTRVIFMQRYWYCMSLDNIAKEQSLTENNVAVILHRTRAEFKNFLRKEDIYL